MTMASQQNRKSINLWRVILPMGTILGVTIAALFFIKGQVGQEPRDNERALIQEGQILPDFEITRQDGSQVKLSELKEKLYLINFWATWCEACVAEMPSIVKLRNDFHPKGFEVLAINLDENPDAVIPKTMRELGMDFPIFKDPNGSTADLFDVHAIPLTVIVNQSRRILLVRDGEHDWNSPEIRSRVEKWLIK